MPNYKKPSIAVSPKLEKKPRIGPDPEAFYEMQPAWRISRMDLARPRGWESLSADKLREVRRKLADLEASTWRDILIINSKYNHHIQVSRVSTEAQARLKKLGHGDLDELLTLRLSSKERVWGVRQGAVLNLLWWDPEHSVYPVNKKHT